MRKKDQNNLSTAIFSCISWSLWKRIQRAQQQERSTWNRCKKKTTNHSSQLNIRPYMCVCTLYNVHRMYINVDSIWAPFATVNNETSVPAKEVQVQPTALSKSTRYKLVVQPKSFPASSASFANVLIQQMQGIQQRMEYFDYKYRNLLGKICLLIHFNEWLWMKINHYRIRWKVLFHAKRKYHFA